MFTIAMRVVQGMLAAEVPFERIEAFIEDESGLDEEERALLWLYAWVGADPRCVAEALGRVGAYR